MAHSHVSYVEVPPDVVFDVLTDLERLPEWNRSVVRVVDRPGWLVPGAEWVLELRAARRTWTTRSAVEVYDRRSRRFVYRSSSNGDDGDRTWSQWAWEVAPRRYGARVSVHWELHLRSGSWRRALLTRLAEWMVRRDVPASLAALSALAGRESGRSEATSKSFDSAVPVGDRSSG